MSDVYKSLKDHFKKDSDVVVNEGKGAQGIKYNNKMFVMFYKGDLTLQFSSDQVQEMINSGLGLPHDPGTGAPMKNRVLIPASKNEHWIKLTEESKKYVMSL